MASIGDRIKESREHRGWTQDRLAQEAKISKGFLSDVENNKGSGSVGSEVVLKVSNALGVSLDYLLRGEDGREERQREPISFPPELSEAAQELHLAYSETLALLEAHRAVIARRANRSIRTLTKDEWKNLHQAISSALPNVPEAKG